MTLFDTHAHYENGRFDADREVVLASLAEKGVAYVANIGSDMETSRQSAALAEQYDYYYVPSYFVGKDKLFEGHAEKSDVEAVFKKVLEQ